MNFLKLSVVLAFLVLSLPAGAVERTGILAPADIKKEQDAVMQMLMSGNKTHQAHVVLRPGWAGQANG